MPQSNSSQTIARQWELLKRLPTRRPGMSAGELTSWLKDNGHKVSKRTVERDLNELSRTFAITCNNQAMPYLWYWVKDAHLDLQSVELSDAVSLALAEQLLKQMLPKSMLKVLAPKFAQSRKKLSALNNNPMARLSDKVRYFPTHLELRPPSLKEEIVEAVQKGLVEHRQIKVSYARFNDRAKEMTLNPLGLVQRGPVPYLIATAEPHIDPRIFAIHRFGSATLTNERSNPPKDFGLDEYLETGAFHFGACGTIQLKAHLSESLASYLTETPISEKQKIAYRENAWALEAEVQDTWQLQFWILSKGADITVLSPKGIKDDIVNTLKLAVKNYAK